MNKQVIGLAVGVVMLVGAGYAEIPARKTYPCHRIAGAITIDGKLDEAAWQGLPEATGFFILRTSSYPKARQTFFRMGWDDQAVYVGIKCQEPDTEKLLALPPEKRGGWGGEIMEFFFMRELPDYRQFAVDVNGKVEFASSFIRTMTARKDLSRDGIQAAANIGAGCWTLEVRFPFSGFDKPPQTGALWRFNIDRESAMASRAGNPGLTTWSYSETSFHDYYSYAGLQFLDTTLNAADAAQAANKINAAYVAERPRREAADQRIADLERRIAKATPVAWTENTIADTRYFALPGIFECYSSQPVTCNAAKIVWNGHSYGSQPKPADDFGLEYWDGHAWQLIFHEASNKDLTSIVTFPPVTTTRLRLTVFRDNRSEYMNIRANLFNLAGE